MTVNIFGWSDQAWLCLDQTGILVGDILMVLTIIGAIWVFFKQDQVRRWFTNNRFPEVGGEFDDDAMDWDGLVFTVSHAEVPKWVMQHCKPSVIALIASDQSREKSLEISGLAVTMGIQVSSTHYVSDADDPQQSRRAVAKALGEMRDHGHKHLAVDVTGGKTPMSLGAFMAAEEAGADTLYVACRFDPQLKKPDMSTATIRRISEVSCKS